MAFANSVTLQPILLLTSVLLCSLLALKVKLILYILTYVMIFT
jgi:hypothetical protein